jgi:hypothetical protein
MELRDSPWRAALGTACVIAAALSGPIAVDPYQRRWDYFPPTILVVVGLAFAWRATRSKARWDRLLGYPLFVVLALAVVYMIFDRLR